MKIINVEYTGYGNVYNNYIARGMYWRDPIIMSQGALDRRDVWYYHPYQYSDFIMFVLQQQLDVLVQTHLEQIVGVQSSGEIIVENARCGISTDFPLDYPNGTCLSIPVVDEEAFLDYFGGLTKINQALDVSSEDWRSAPPIARSSRGYKNEKTVFQIFRSNEALKIFLVQEDGFQLMHRLIDLMNFVSSLITEGGDPLMVAEFVYSQTNPIQSRYDEWMKLAHRPEASTHYPEFDKALIYFFSHTFGEPLFMDYDMRTNVGMSIDHEFFPIVKDFFKGTILGEEGIIIGI